MSQQPENCENRNDPDLVHAFLKKKLSWNRSPKSKIKPEKETITDCTPGSRENAVFFECGRIWLLVDKSRDESTENSVNGKH